MKKEIIFISHEASRTGAPILLLQFLRWLKKNTNISFRIVLAIGGDLEAEFTQLAPTLVFEQSLNYKLSEKIKKRIFPNDTSTRLKQWLGDANIGLIYSNTIVNGNILECLKFLNCAVISHVHELEYIIQCYGLDNLKKIQKYTSYYIACADAVKANLVENHNISCSTISVVHEFIPIDSVKAISLNSRILKNELNLPEQTFIVGGSGSSSDWRKGADLFIQVAYIVKNKAKDIPIQFVWIGRHDKGIEYLILQQDIMKAGIENYIHFIGSKSNPLDYFAGLDVFTLTSREDPYPLVCLENASLGTPIICFEKSGGEPEFVENDCGFVIPYLDLNTMADRIVELYYSPELRQKLGDNARKKVVDRHSLEMTASKILEIIEHQAS